MWQTTNQKAVLVMREQQRRYGGGTGYKTYNTGTTIVATDVTSYAATSRLNIPGVSNTSTGIGFLVVEKLGRVTPEQGIYRVAELNPLRPLDIVTFVRDVFGLNVSDAAQVFGVGRPTIYLWANALDMGAVRTAKQDRMKQVYRVAKLCEKVAPLPVGALKAALPESGETLLDLLSEEPINLNKVGQAMQRLKSMAPAFRQLEHEKSVKVVKELKGAFKAMGTNQASRKKS